MLQGKKAYICSPLSAPNPEGMQHNMELAKYYLMQMKRLYHCRTFASHAHLPLMLDDRIPEERETAMQIAVLMLDLCEVLIICGSHISEGMRSEIQTAFGKKPPPTLLINFGWVKCIRRKILKVPTN